MSLHVKMNTSVSFFMDVANQIFIKVSKGFVSLSQNIVLTCDQSQVGIQSKQNNCPGHSYKNDKYTCQ